jgi:Tol biopolymer transport system component
VRHTRERIIWIGALIAVVTVTALLAISLRQQITPQEVRLEINTPPSSSLAMAVSPDGRKIVFPVQTEDGTRLWLRSLDSDVTRPLPGTEDGDFPFWSPDSRTVGYVTAMSIKRIDVDTGAVQQIANRGAIGGTWARDGTILVGGNLDPILRLPATGGTMVPVTSARQAGLKLFPQFLPDGKHFLYYVVLSPRKASTSAR